MVLAFIGHFSPVADNTSAASSPAGNLVQLKILQELRAIVNDKVACYSMSPQPAWPKGRLWIRGTKDGLIVFPGFLNLPILKHIFFSVRVFLMLIRAKPNDVIIYNSYLFENIMLLVYRRIVNCKIAMIIQDYHGTWGSVFDAKSLFRTVSELAAGYLVAYYDFCIPISKGLAEKLRLPESKFAIFQGGVTEFAEHLKIHDDRELQQIAIFAGSLEPHNGVGVLVDCWVDQNVPVPLHVYGRGSLEAHVRAKAGQSDMVIFHGFCDEAVVAERQAVATWNFCLRYSEKLNEDFFFPSKLFNMLICRGAVVANEFGSIPDDIRKFITFVDGPLGDLKSCMAVARARNCETDVLERRSYVMRQFSWRRALQDLIIALAKRRA